MQRTILAVAAAAVFGGTLTACAVSTKPAEVTSGTVLRNVTVVDTRTGALAHRMAVVIDQGSIRQTLPDAAVRISGNAKIVDGGGKYVVPGYLDMHTHALPAAVLHKAPSWPLFLANGVTGIREMAGAPPLIAAAREFNAARSAGTLDAPAILQVSGPVIVGRTAEDGIQGVRQTKAIGGDFVKVVSASPSALPAILAEARAQGLGVAGHLSPGTGALETAKAGWTVIEHLGGIWSIALDCANEQAAIRADLLAGKGSTIPSPLPPSFTFSPYVHGAADAPHVQRLLDTYNSDLCGNSVAKSMVELGTWQVPTMIRLHTMTNSDSSVFRNDPNLKYVNPQVRTVWNKLSTDFEYLRPASAADTFRKSYTSFVDTLKLLRKHGGASRMLIGTDVGGIWVVPGFSIHQEFREFAKAGFTPLEILQATTLNGARFLNRESTMGTVEAGKNADLVLLDANPVADAANLSKIAGVFNAGKYFPKSALDTMLANVAAAHAEAPARDVSTVADISHKH